MSSEFTLVILGARNTGKTSLVERYVLGPTTKPSRPTIEDVYRKQLPNGETAAIIDTSGELNMIDNLRDLYQSSANGYVITFDLHNNKSLARAKLEYEHALTHRKPIVVVATHVGKPIDSEKQRNYFRNATFFVIDLERQSSSIVFESLLQQIKDQTTPRERNRSKFCLWSCCK